MPRFFLFLSTLSRLFKRSYLRGRNKAPYLSFSTLNTFYRELDSMSPDDDPYNLWVIKNSTSSSSSSQFSQSIKRLHQTDNTRETRTSLLTPNIDYWDPQLQQPVSLNDDLSLTLLQRAQVSIPLQANHPFFLSSTHPSTLEEITSVEQIGIHVMACILLNRYDTDIDIWYLGYIVIA